MEPRSGLKKRAKAYGAGTDEAGQDAKTWLLFLFLSVLTHGLFFVSVMFFHGFEPTAVPPEIIQVDLVSFGAGPEDMAPLPPAQDPDTALASDPVLPKPAEPKVETAVPADPAPDTPAAEPEEPAVIIKPDISLKAKPENLKEIMAKQEKKPEEKQPKKALKPKADPEKTLDKARQRIADKVDRQKEQQIADALKRLRQSVNEGERTGSSTGAGGSRKGYQPIDFYKMELQLAIEKNWVFNDILAGMDQNLQVRILIKILKNGEIQDITYETKSGNGYLDESAKKAIKRANPLPELPQGMQSYDVVVIFTPKGLK